MPVFKRGCPKRINKNHLINPSFSGGIQFGIIFYQLSVFVCIAIHTKVLTSVVHAYILAYHTTACFALPLIFPFFLRL